MLYFDANASRQWLYPTCPYRVVVVTYVPKVEEMVSHVEYYATQPPASCVGVIEMAGYIHQSYVEVYDSFV